MLGCDIVLEKNMALKDGRAIGFIGSFVRVSGTRLARYWIHDVRVCRINVVVSNGTVQVDRSELPRS